MGKFQREQEKVADIVRDWSGEERLWIHVYGENGSGKKEFIRSLREKELAGLFPVLYCDFSIFPLQQWPHLRNLIRQVTRDHPAEFQGFLQTLPRKWANLLAEHFARGAQDAPAPAGPRVGETWELNVFSEFLNYLSQKRRLLLILPGFFEPFTEYSHVLLGVLDYAAHLPLVVLTSGSAAAEASPPGIAAENIFINKRSVRETERIVAEHFRTEPMSSRLITNHLYIKSSGNFQKILFMLEAYYRPLIKPGGRKRSIDHEALQSIRPSARLENVFAQLVACQPGAMVDILSFLCRLDDPLPADLFQQIARKKGFGRRNYQAWVASGMIREEVYLNVPHVLIAWAPWKAYLRQNTSIERAAWIFQFLKKQLSRLNFARPVELSTQFLDMGDFPTALELAHREARVFAGCGEYQRALERYAFLHRNFSRLTAGEKKCQDVLREMGEIQMKSGLYENAFESFRELRERLKRGQRQAWVSVSLQMADALFQMDSLSEAHYIVKDLKIKKDVPLDVQVFSNLLNGELEHNFGHPEYALKYYQKALAMLPGVRDETLIMRLYEILKTSCQSMPAMEQFPEIVQQIQRCLPSDSPHQSRLRFDLVRWFINRNEYRAALPYVLALHREAPRWQSPRQITQVRLYLGDIYAYLGKWYLARSHLKKLLDSRVMLSNTRVRVDVQTRLGIVEKELGHYGAAIDLLQKALQLSRQQHLMRQVYQIKIHLGHIYLLVCGFVRARDHLMSALEWAGEHQNDEIEVTAALFMASYGLQQNQLTTAKKYLNKAHETLKMLDSPFDQLNYRYYLAIYQLKTGQLEEAESTVQSWREMANGMVKFENLALLLLGKIMMHQGRLQKARQYLETALLRNSRCRLPYFQFQILRDLAVLAKQEGDTANFQRYNQQAHEAFEELLAGVGDEILQRQIEESREYDELLQLSG